MIADLLIFESISIIAVIILIVWVAGMEDRQ